MAEEEDPALNRDALLEEKRAELIPELAKAMKVVSPCAERLADSINKLEQILEEYNDEKANLEKTFPNELPVELTETGFDPRVTSYARSIQFLSSIVKPLDAETPALSFSKEEATAILKPDPRFAAKNRFEHYLSIVEKNNRLTGLRGRYSINHIANNLVNFSDINMNEVTKKQEIREFMDSFTLKFHFVTEDIIKHSDCIKKADEEYVAARIKVEEELGEKEGLLETIALALGIEAEDEFNRSLRNLEAENLKHFFGDSFTLETATKILFKEQCWLLSYVAQLAEFKKKVLDPDNDDGNSTTKKRLPYQVSDGSYSTNASLLVDGDPYAFINKLTVDPATAYLFDIENSDLSKLQPRIRLFKTYYDKVDDIKEVEISFDSHHASIDSTLKGKIGRGIGVGISSFNFAYEGSNPFSIKKSITGNLKIFANSMKELFTVRGRGEEKWRYTDLAMKTGDISTVENSCTDFNEENSRLRTLNFRLRAQVGLSELVGAGNSALNVALRESFVTLNLTPTVHNFEIDEQGRVIFNINFLSYIEEFFDDSTYNVFANSYSGDKMTAMSRFKRKVETEYLLKTCGRENANAAEKNFEGEISEETAVSITAIINRLMSKDKIFYINLEQEQIKNFTSAGPFKITDKESIEKKIRQQIEDQNTAPTDLSVNGFITTGQEEASDLPERLEIVEEKFRTATGEQKTNIARALAAGANPNEMVISYFYVSDLIDTILANIDLEMENLLDEMFFDKVDIPSIESDPGATEFIKRKVLKKRRELIRHQNNFKKLRILLGPTELFTNRKSEIDPGTPIHVNLGDIPISVKYFLEWITDKMLKKREVVYPLTKFLNDLFNDLVKSFLNNDSCFGYSVKQKTRIGQATLTSTGVGGEDKDERIKSQLLYTSATRLDMDATEPPILKLSGHSGARTKINIDEEYNYFVFYASRIQPTEMMEGKRGKDQQRGIFHYILGRDKGLIKNIKLTKTQTPGLAEVRFEQEGYDGLTQLRVIYDVQIETFANVNTFPGTYIYVDPHGFVPSGIEIEDTSLTYSDLGIGGYYMIIKSEHEFGPGYANTSIHARWVNSIESAQKDNCEITDIGAQQQQKCEDRK